MGRGNGTFNPYTPDSGARPPALTGREPQLTHLQSIITQLSAGGTEKHVLITGLRGVGKTVLLNEFEGMCEQAGWPAEAKEVGRNSSIATLVGRAARRAMLQMSAHKRAGQRLRQALRVLKAFEVTLPGSDGRPRRRTAAERRCRTSTRTHAEVGLPTARRTHQQRHHLRATSRPH